MVDDVNDERPDPCIDFILQKNRPLRLIIRRDMRSRITVITSETINDWVLGVVTQSEPTCNKLQ